MLEVRGITKFYGSGRNAFRALDNVNINFGGRGLVVVLGKSGCGKSTLLNIIGGLDMPTYGEVVINGQSTRNFSRSDYDAYRNTFVGIVFQEFNLIDDISVYDNINMTMKLQEKNADVNTVDEALSMVGLANLGYRKPSELSGGQRQRVALARALLKKPEIILADEPTGALDSVTGEEVFETLKRIAQTKLVIVVTHNRDLANAYADRIIEIVDGRIVGDKSRAVTEAEGVKELEAGVIEVGAGGKVTKEQINERLKEGSVNFIGLTHEKDRIALCYPETVEGFYEAQSEASFKETEDENIRKDNKPFKLGKGGLNFKDSVKMARESLKRKKKRTRFLILIMSICFTLFSLALVVGMVDFPSVIANTAFDKGAQPFVEITGTGRSLYAEQAAIVSKIMKDEPAYYKRFDGYDYSPEYADAHSYSGSYYDINYFDMSFCGVLETSSLSAMRLSLVGGVGKDRCENTSEVMISDFAAHVLIKKGFVGYDVGGVFGAHYPQSVKDIVGSKIKLASAGKYFTVVGVFDTDYEDYAAIVGGSALNEDVYRLMNTFEQNKRFLYSALIGCEGLAKEVMPASKVQRYSMSVEGSDSHSGYYTYVYLSDCEYDPYEVSDTVVWSETTDNDGSFKLPETLPRDGIVVNLRVLKDNFASEYDMKDEDFIASDKMTAALEKTYSVAVSRNAALVGRMQEARIVAVVATEGYSRAVLFSHDFINSISDYETDLYDSLYFPRGTKSELEGKLREINKYNKDKNTYAFLCGTSKLGAGNLDYYDYLFSMLGFGFAVAAAVLLVLAFLITFNYMTASIRFRTKEIAVYRVIGAKTWDVAKIFFTEGGFIAAIVSTISILLSLVMTMFINETVYGVFSGYSMSVSLLFFNPILQPLVIILGCSLTVLLSSLAPILRVCGKAPVEAVKLI